MAASKWANENILDCECDVSISEMSAKGHQIRTRYFSSDRKAMYEEHFKMVGAVASLIWGAYLAARVNPWLGLAVMILGGLAANEVVKDYKTGKEYYDSMK